MKCCNCGKEMKKGFLFATKDGAFSFADEVPGVFVKANKAPGFVEITELKLSHRIRIEANICEDCRFVAFNY